MIATVRQMYGNFFQREYDAAKKGVSQFLALFISWFDIDIQLYHLRMKMQKQTSHRSYGRIEITQMLVTSVKRVVNTCGICGNLQLSKQYTGTWKNAKENSDSPVASEYPSDRKHLYIQHKSIWQVFVKGKLKSCCPPQFIGDMVADGDEGKDASKGSCFVEDHQVCGYGRNWNMGQMKVNKIAILLLWYWRAFRTTTLLDNCIWQVLYDDGDNALFLHNGKGHTDMDIVSAWKSAQIAAYYDNALLVQRATRSKQKTKTEL